LSFLQPCHSPNLVILSAAKNLLNKAKDQHLGGYINHPASPNNLVILSAAKNLLSEAKDLHLGGYINDHQLVTPLTRRWRKVCQPRLSRESHVGGGGV